jgi:ABC-type amino acid transport substrate-binding protein
VLIPQKDSRTSSLGDLCGAQVGALKSSPGEDEILKQNEGGCSSKRIHYQAYDDGTKGVQDLRAGKLAAFVDEYASAVYFARIYAGIKLVPRLVAPTKEVMVFSVGDGPLRDAISTALDRLKQDGTYSRLLRQWGLDQGGV